MYQNAKLWTNILLKDYPIVTFEDFKDKYSYLMKLLEQRHIEEDIINEVMYRHYLRQNKVFPFNDNDDFQKYSNGEEGVIFFVDEIQLYLNYPMTSPPTPKTGDIKN